MGGHAQDQPQGTHQTAKARPSSSDATQAAKEPTTAEKWATHVPDLRFVISPVLVVRT